MRFSRAVVKYRVPILILALILMVPSVFGMLGTRINYDMLDYLPADIDTVIGQNELLEDFGKGAFSLIIVEDMPEKDVAALCDKIKTVDHVETVLWYSTLADLQHSHGAFARRDIQRVQHRPFDDDRGIL